MAKGTTLFEKPRLCHDWKELQSFYEDLSNINVSTSGGPRWVFRGDKVDQTLCVQPGELTKDAAQLMQEQETKLRKGLKNYLPDRHKGKAEELERHLVREFQRHLHLHSTLVPARADILEWLALMQHYEGPTRLLDCTYSFYTACYFALARMNPAKEVGIVWAVDAKWIEKCESKWLENDPARSVHMDKWARQKKRHLSYMDYNGIKRNALVWSLVYRADCIVLNLTPFRKNDRLTIQQGTFLVPGSLGYDFCENLQGSWKICQETSAPPVQCTIIRFDGKDQYDNRNKILCELRAMNLSQEVLFPGLQGFSESLWHRLAYPWFSGDGEFMDQEFEP